MCQAYFWIGMLSSIFVFGLLDFFCKNPQILIHIFVIASAGLAIYSISGSIALTKAKKEAEKIAKREAVADAMLLVRMEMARKRMQQTELKTKRPSKPTVPAWNSGLPKPAWR